MKIKQNSEYQKEWRKNHKDRFDKCRKEWNKKNKEKLKKIRSDCRIKHKKEYRQKDRERLATIRKYGKLKKGFEYHHTTIPYNRDKFIILEKGFHRFYHEKLKGVEFAM
ncbi:MAG: hypothetical protein IMZ51_04005 [Chloroflexi bacterium]|nr:hypothetical protein [Chloroflexota bacterium]